MTYLYKAKSRSSKLHSGELQAVSKKAAMQELMSQQLQPISLVEKEAPKSRSVESNSEFSARELVIFTEELSELLNAGLSIEPALSAMEAREEKGALKLIASKLRERVTDGMSLNKALKLTSSRFDSLYVNLVAAGEASGALAEILREHASYLKEQAKLKSKMLVAMIYPGCLLFLCASVIMVFIFYLLPQITTMLSSNQSQKLPVGLELATAFGDFVREKWIVLIVVVMLLILVIKIFFMKEANRNKWDKVKVFLPFYGKIYEYGFYVQWSKTLSNLLNNGLTQVQSLKLANETVMNNYFQTSLVGVLSRVEDGIKLTSSMKRSDVFPQNMIDLIAVGDKTGDMAASVKRASEYYELKLSNIMNSLMALITPVVLLGMALVIGALSYTMMQAIYGAIESMRK